MDILKIEGGRRLSGEVAISGSKNAALPILAATLLTDDPCILTNVPDLVDIETMIALLVFLGKNIVRQSDTLTISSGPTLYGEAPYELVRRMRASVVVVGPLLARLGKARASLPGGCAIGGRPINIHLEGFKALGADVTLEQGYVSVETKGLQGAMFHMDFPSVGATQNLVMAAALAKGRSVLQNVAREPEIADLIKFLVRMGARIEGEGSDTLVVEGVQTLHGAEHSIIPDRIEAGTFLAAGAMTGGDLTVTRTVPDHLGSFLSKLKLAGLRVTEGSDYVKVSAGRRIVPVDAETAVYPGFPTDLQAQWMALMTLSTGTSQITEKVFENRFMHVPELQRMGAQIAVGGNTASVQGVEELSGADVMVSDLRAGAALVLAALAAKGESVIHRIYHLDRGYEKLEAKLSALGAKIQRMKE